MLSQRCIGMQVEENNERKSEDDLLIQTPPRLVLAKLAKDLILVTILLDTKDTVKSE